MAHEQERQAETRPWTPSTDLDGAMAKLMRWPGLRREIRQGLVALWEATPAGASRFETSRYGLQGLWAPPGGDALAPSAVSQKLKRLRELGLVIQRDVDRRIVLEFVAPAEWSMIPQGNAAKAKHVVTGPHDPTLPFPDSEGDAPTVLRLVRHEDEDRQDERVRVVEPDEGRQDERVRVIEPDEGRQDERVRVIEPNEGRQDERVRVIEPDEGDNALSSRTHAGERAKTNNQEHIDLTHQDTKNKKPRTKTTERATRDGAQEARAIAAFEAEVEQRRAEMAKENGTSHRPDARPAREAPRRTVDPSVERDTTREPDALAIGEVIAPAIDHAVNRSAEERLGEASRIASKVRGCVGGDSAWWVPGVIRQMCIEQAIPTAMVLAVLKEFVASRQIAKDKGDPVRNPQAYFLRTFERVTKVKLRNDWRKSPDVAPDGEQPKLE